MHLTFIKVNLIKKSKKSPSVSTGLDPDLGPNCLQMLSERISKMSSMRGSRKFNQRGSNSDNVFLVDERRGDPNTTKSGAIIGPPAKRRRNEGPTLNAGLVAL